MTDFPPALYLGQIDHSRAKKPKHHFAQPVLYCLLDIATVETLARKLHLFSHNRFNLFAFFESDHGTRDGSSLADWVCMQLRAAGLADLHGPVYLLTQPRVLGHAFNPLSVYFCHDRESALRALIYEVHNTYGEAHAYVAPIDRGFRHRAEKIFRVSPFLPSTGSYDFAIKPPGEAISLTIVHRDSDGTLTLTATLEGIRRPFNDWSLLHSFLKRPFSTQRTSAAIYRQAAVIWFKSWLRRVSISERGRRRDQEPF